MRWESRCLDQVADFCLGKMLDEKKNRGEAFPYLANINVRWGEFDLKDLRLMRFESDEMERYGLKLGDIVMCEGGEPGRCAIWREQLPGMMIQKALHRIRPHDCLDYRFLYYSFLQMGKIGRFSEFLTGATIKHLPRQNLAKLEIAVPPLSLQLRIADILSSYDDLIENNRRRMGLLEEAARLLYQEWFVRLRFPGHEHTHITNGVPEGWGKCRVGNLGAVITGKTPSTKNLDNYGGTIPFVKTPDMHGNIFVTATETSLTEKGANTQPRKFIPKNTLLISCIGTIGVVSLTSVKSQFNQQINAVIPLEESYLYYCFFAFKDLKESMEAIGGVATMGNVSKTKFEGLEILKPTATLFREFHEYCCPIFDQTRNLQHQNQKLRAARDLLLPRLMSGEMAV